MPTPFQPIAIVGSGCILPGCRTVADLWDTVARGHVHLAHAPEGDWRVPMEQVLSTAPGSYVADRTWSDIGGYVRDFADVFNPAATRLGADLVSQLDPVFQWSLYAARQALQTAALSPGLGVRTGVILGNLSYPSRAHNRYAEQKWFKRITGMSLPDDQDVHAWNRFMSGLPAMLIAREFGFGGDTLALDAACASGLYAIKLACDRLQDGRADLMLAGAVNAADQLFLHVGFSALNALSRTGQSRPFSQGADGLVPAEGAAFVALKRLDDALASKDTILGVIRGIGLSNDGRSGGFLSPSQAGQSRCMRDALTQAGLSPSDVQYVECHATGTPVGDATEVASLASVYAGCEGLPIGSLKANLGHLITASGVAGLIKVLAAMKHGEIPATPGSRPLTGALGTTGFLVPEHNVPWNDCNGQRTAAVSSFGFGGNNAHLIVQQRVPETTPVSIPGADLNSMKFAVVGLGVRTHQDRNAEAFAARLFGEEAQPDTPMDDTIALGAAQLAFPPADLKQALGQQLILLDVVQDATRQLDRVDSERTGIYVGMQTDSEICRYGLRWRWSDLVRQVRQPAATANVNDTVEAISRSLDAAGVIGKMPNICANRLSNQMNIRGPGFAVSREELSGDAALDLACTAIRRGEIDTALVAAVDLCREHVHEDAARRILGQAGAKSADAAVMLAIKSLAQAERDGNTILAIVSRDTGVAGVEVSNLAQDSPVHGMLGHAHAASGLLHLALGMLMLRHRRYVTAAGAVQPLLPSGGPRCVNVNNVSFTGERASWQLQEAVQPVFLPVPHLAQPPELMTYAADDVEALLARLREGRAGGNGACRLAIVAEPGQAALLRAKALHLLASGEMGDAWTLEGISFQRRPISGDMAFAFTGAAAAYPGMGRELLLGIPNLTDRLALRMQDMEGTVGWAYRRNDPQAKLPFYQLAGSSFLCQLHTELSRNWLGLKPTASIGLSSGETNAMFAFGVWQNFDALLDDIADSGLYSEALANTFNAIRTYWGLPTDAPVNWDNYRLRAPVEAVRKAVADLDRVYLTIVNSASDCVIGGDADACRKLIAALDNPPAVPLGHNLAIHCPAVMPFEPMWRRLHTRPTASVQGIRFYSNHFGGVFVPTEQSVAEALTGQALKTIDFPKIVNQAWEDGVRVFVEHGPRNGLSTAIGEILADREHLAVPLDRPGVPALTQAFRAAAQLWCAGQDVDLERLRSSCLKTPANAQAEDATPAIRFRLRPPDIPAVTQATPIPPVPATRNEYVKAPLPLQPMQEASQDIQTTGAGVYVLPPLQGGDPEGCLLPAAPALAYLVTSTTPVATASQGPAAAFHTLPSQPVVEKTAVAAIAPHVPSVDVQKTDTPAPTFNRQGLTGLLVGGHRQLVDVHQAYLQAQQKAQQAYMELNGRMQAALFNSRTIPAAIPAAPVMPQPAAVPVQAALIAPAPAPAATFSPPPVALANEVALKIYPGPALSRQQLEVLAGGQISSVLGDRFKAQDHYMVQVRMPEPPLLLCDRVLGIEGEAHSMGQGTIWTETDVGCDSWYLHHGRMPAGIFIESGQADLLLISWLGIDAFNQGERAYRLLGCELVFHGDLPKPGDTLHYEIKVDGHARQGDVRLFFFHYDCHVNGELRLSVRNGQAGFFSKAELAASAGVIWTAEKASYSTGATVAPAPVPTRKTRFSVDDVHAYLGGDLVTCFGPEFYWANTHTRTPGSAAGRHNFLGEVTELNFAGGPAGRGYLRVEKPVQPDEWFFDGHFKNDPCMPGTLMAEACLQAMAFYLAATGRTLVRDGWRFKPVSEQQYRFKCRGQVTPESQRIVYEIFVDEITDGPMPVLYAHVLASVDGRKAFLCERLGLQLVPDWPLTSMQDAIAGLAEAEPDSRPLEMLGEFPLDYRSLINCAWGRPSDAFGQGFAHYDGPRRSPRLPGPPYHFMTRITALQGEMGHMKPGARVTAVYDLEPEAWYFRDNASATMPNCVLMEVALQPCGWLASFTLSRAASERELLFRNLDGESVQMREITPADQTITTAVELLSVSQVGDLIIEKFSVVCTIDEEEVLKVETVFGFFPPAAMINQKGFGATEEDMARLALPSETRLELDTRPAQLFAGRGSARLPGPHLLMIDRISGYWPLAGKAGYGAIRTEKDVDSSDWFFKAHFYQDPVQPGSLGIEAMLQTVQAFMLLSGMDAGIDNPRFEPIDIGGETVWHYRGQVTPDKARITVEFEVTASGRDTRGAFVTGFGRLWVDGLQIYQAPQIGMRIVATPPALREPAGVSIQAGLGTATVPQTESVTEHHWELDLRRVEDAWILDHRPTYTLPTLPFTYELEMMVAAAKAVVGSSHLVGIDSAEACQWLSFPGDFKAGRTLVSRAGTEQADATLQFQDADGRIVSAATARLTFATHWPSAGLAPLEPLRNPGPATSPYEDGCLFHGPALQLMRNLVLGSNGAQAVLTSASRGVPVGTLHPGLLDAALHCIPHDDFRRWCPAIDEGMAAYPLRIESMRLYGALAREVDLEVHARFIGIEHGRFPRTHLRLQCGKDLLVSFDLVEVLLPKGRLGNAPAPLRRAFLEERRFAPGIALATVGETESFLHHQEVQRTDWLPGTLRSIYDLGDDHSGLAREITIRDHVGATLRLHPADVRSAADGERCPNLPLNFYTIDVTDTEGTVTVRSPSPAPLEWESLYRDWSARMTGSAAFIRDLGIALIRRFVRRVVLADPDGYAALRGKPVLYLGNHQTAVESFLFLACVTSLSGMPAGAIAKREHTETWIGNIYRLAEHAMGINNPLRMLFFDRSNQADMLRLLKEYGDTLQRDPYSLLVHVDGTRSQVAGAPVRNVSSVLIDLALSHDMPIVPVRFAGGIGIGHNENRFEFPAGYGQQDYFIGKSITADALRAIPYAQRARRVADAINRLGPAGEADQPLGSDDAFAAAVSTAMAQGRNEVQAVVYEALRDFPVCDSTTQQWLEGAIPEGQKSIAPLVLDLIGPAVATSSV
jgi:acyl transferase domain-containing protein/3-hydroxymyristoyl/3-hydroxydecanoyl-(acyl carrier protein) dehydratase/1-acyl-sn-glycerol-3-phosphate acyltransferase